MQPAARRRCSTASRSGARRRPETGLWMIRILGNCMEGTHSGEHCEDVEGRMVIMEL
jgi:hypothetical protein